MHDWTVVWVNFFSSVYLSDQLKSLYRNESENFKLIIIDNSNDLEESQQIEKILEKYSEFKNINLIYNKPKPNTLYKDKEDMLNHVEVDQHGAALNLAKELLDTKYVLFYDLDFFWLRKNIFEYFEKHFEQGYRTLGAPYPYKVGYGNPDFPALFGCAHYTEDIKNIDLGGEYTDQQKKEEAYKLYPLEEGYTFSLDVGHRVRTKLSPLKYKSFRQQSFPKLIKKLGYYGPGTPMMYFDERPIAIHLFGGSRKVEQTPFFFELSENEISQMNESWKKVRKRYAESLNSLYKQNYYIASFICYYVFLKFKEIIKKSKTLVYIVKKSKQFLKKGAYNYDS